MRPKLLLACLAALLLAAPARAQTSSGTAPDATVAPGDTVTLAVTADGYPFPLLEWFRDGKKVGEGDKLALGAVTPAQAGAYTVKATNIVGTAVSPPFLLAIGAAPGVPVIKIITNRPQSVTVEVPRGTTVRTK